jgi:hypothetical protein
MSSSLKGLKSLKSNAEAGSWMLPKSVHEVWQCHSYSYPQEGIGEHIGVGIMNGCLVIIPGIKNRGKGGRWSLTVFCLQLEEPNQ